VRLRAETAVLALLLSGCPGSLENPDRFTQGQLACPVEIDVEVDIFQMKCSDAGCHGATQPASGLDLVTPGVAERMLGKMAVGCPGRLLIDAERQSDSVLLDRLSAMPECGLRMPLGRTPLSDDELDCVEEWVREAVETATTSTQALGGGR
jgi:hypothetical protein